MTTKRCDASTKNGRLKKARGFFAAADMIETLDDEGDLVDAIVTLLIHAGIAAADAICCARLGQHAEGQDHREAVELIGKVDRGHAADLRTLLSLKTRSGYSSTTTSQANARSATRAAERLVGAAEQA